MPFKDLLLLTRKDTEAGDHYALWLAEFCEAKLTAASPVVGAALPTFILPDMPSDILSQIREDAENAARSSLDAFCESAKQTGLITDAGGDRPLPSEGMARHLARHGIKAEGVGLPNSGVGVGNTLLSYAADLDAGLIVMGGYGHSRLREMVLGGTTRTILQSMTVPVLMAH